MISNVHDKKNFLVEKFFLAVLARDLPDFLTIKTRIHVCTLPGRLQA